MDIVRPKERAKGECDTHVPKEDPQKLPEKRGKKQGSLLSRELVGGLKEIANHLQCFKGGEDTRKKGSCT